MKCLQRCYKKKSSRETVVREEDSREERRQSQQTILLSNSKGLTLRMRVVNGMQQIRVALGN